MLKNVPFCLNELLVNFREEATGIRRFCKLKVPTDGLLAHFRFFYRNWASWPSVGIQV